MDVLQSIRARMEHNVGLIDKCFEEVLVGLESKEKLLNAVQESLCESSKELDLTRESIEEWVKQVTKKEEDLTEIQLVQQKGLRDLELRKQEMGLILEDIKIREEKLEAQEKLIAGLFEKIELERGKFECIQKSIDGKFDEVSRKERLVLMKEEELIEFQLVQEKEFQDLELKKKEMSLNLEDIKDREQKLEGQEKLIAELFERIELERGKLESIQKFINGKFEEINEERRVVMREEELVQEKGFRDLELKKKEMSLILEDIKAREEKLEGQEKLIAEMFEKIDLYRGRFDSIEKSIDGKFDEISCKERLLMKKEEELNEFQLVQEKGFRDLELKKKEIGLILQDIKVREEKLEGQEKLAAGLFEKVELERGKYASIQKSIDGKFDEISLKERHLEEKSEKFKLEIVLREKILASKEEMLVAKEKELEARARILDLKTGEFGLTKAYVTQPGELRNKRRKGKSGRTDTDKELIDPVAEVSGSPDAPFVRPIVITDSSESDLSSNAALYEYADPEYYDFEKDKKENCFAVNQFWAIYDTVDVMPRQYAQITEVDNQEFRLRITWLEVDPKYQSKIGRVDLPVACGEFRRAQSEDINDCLIFSHQIHCEECLIGSYVIYPRKGEIWALFKEWNLGSSSKSACHKQYNYEIVEVMSDFIETRGINVVYLDKIKGYVSLFHRAVRNGTFWIGEKEMVRFSHQIPCYRMNGTAEGVPEGSLELDTAALPISLCDNNCYPDKDEVNSKGKRKKSIFVD